MALEKKWMGATKKVGDPVKNPGGSLPARGPVLSYFFVQVRAEDIYVYAVNLGPLFYAFKERRLATDTPQPMPLEGQSRFRVLRHHILNRHLSVNHVRPLLLLSIVD
jgi:hypothetical protein